MSRFGNWWKILLGVAVVLVIVAWDMGLPGHQSPAAAPASPARQAPSRQRHPQ